MSWVGSGRVTQNGPMADPVGGWTAMSRGLSSSVETRTVLIDASVLDTSMRRRAASVQYSLPVTQSTARPTGLSRPSDTTTYTTGTTTTHIHPFSGPFPGGLPAIPQPSCVPCERTIWRSHRYAALVGLLSGRCALGELAHQ